VKRLVFVVTHGVTANLLLRGQLSFLRESGFDVTVIASPGPDLEAVREREKITTVGVAMTRDVRLHEGPRALAEIASALHRIKPDIVNASTAKAGLLGMLGAYGVRVPKRVYLVRGLRFEGYRGARRLALAQAERVTAACATDVVCVSDSVRDVVVRDGLTPRRKTHVIPSNGIDPKRFRSRNETRADAERVRRELGIPDDAFVVGFIGRLVADKGVDDMLDALERVPNAWFLVVGGNMAGDHLPPKTADRLRSRPRVVQVGRVAEPAPFYAAMDVLLFASHREGLPNVPLEAAACELPVLGYRVTGVVDAVEDGATGTLVPPRDSRALGAALLRHQDDPALRATHGAAGRSRVLERFTQAATWNAWADLYRV
jgi:glycosyltransferase involved in cell wall biosynthesis